MSLQGVQVLRLLPSKNGQSQEYAYCIFMMQVQWIRVQVEKQLICAHEWRSQGHSPLHWRKRCASACLLAINVSVAMVRAEPPTILWVCS